MPHEATSERLSLETLVDVTLATAREPGRLDAFLTAASPWVSLAVWAGGAEALRTFDSREALSFALHRDMARLDAMLERQMNAILHHPRFQGLEASWRGLRYLVDVVTALDDTRSVEVRALNASWKEVTRDVERAIEFDQMSLFRKVYSDEFGRPGGKPFGVLLADYEIRHRPDRDHPYVDLDTLEGLMQVSAAALAPLILGAHPALFGVDRFDELVTIRDLPETFRSVDYVKWRALRETPDSRYVAITVPRVLMRPIYGDDPMRRDRFRFTEALETEDGRDAHLFGTAVYAYGAVLVRSFTDSGWFGDIRGIRRDDEGGGLVPLMDVEWFDTDRRGLVPKPVTDVVLPSDVEETLSELGFLTLCRCWQTERCAFTNSQTFQKPAVYDTLDATTNARLSALLQYVLCASRFGHYIKVLMREKVGSLLTAAEIERYLARWLHAYTAATDDLEVELRAKHPLRDARVAVSEKPGLPGTYDCVAHLQPHFQVDQMVSALKLVTELSGGARSG